ncbi:Serine/threonine-protein kinase PknB [Anatilimnocola aggregata]|uniref:Serine/threonine-protein kinase PknB n=1 Tax=Anatilimnocola aggregata TaxID=2528021 RepID=A0A517YDR7_9BACT|nr:serine/threonine-protein kinase [Anatilimnocola aggregata]QDU28368.1 Serine/threonine-protein kinase PknB [Anatilimnocola aggregata]
MPPQVTCPPNRALEHFLLGRLEDEDSLSLENHLTSCTNCQQQLTTLAAEDEFVETLRLYSRLTPAHESFAYLPDAPEELVKLLVPHFKQITLAIESTIALPVSAADTPTFPKGLPLPATSAADPSLPKTIGRYEIQGVLGSGGMGTVLHAHDPLLKRSVAIKVIHGELLAEKGIATRLVREAQAAAAIEHDHIVAIYSVETHEGLPCIVMPMLRGVTLKRCLEETTGPLPLAEILRIGREAASGLAAAHSAGLIHCDIKPANLWLETPRGRVKVLDFGLAIVHGENDADTEAISGTPGYLAPEQARGLALDQRSDLFSLGCVLYRMATGISPFTGERRMRALWTVLSDPPPPATKLNPKVPTELSDLIGRMLARDPSERPATSAAVVEALESFERRLVDQQYRMIRRRWFAAMLAVALMSGCAVAWWGMMNTPAAEAPVKVTFSGDEPSFAVVLRRDGHEQSLTLGREKTLDLQPGDYTVRPATELPGRRLVPDHFSVLADKPQALRIALVGEITQHVTHTQPVTCVAVRPGLTPLVLSAGLDRTLVAWDPTSSATPRFVDLPHAARCLAVSPDGNYVATAGGNKQPPAELAIRIWDAQKLIPRGEPLAGHTRMITALSYSPNGERIASAGADGVLLWNLNTGESQALVQESPQVMFALAYSADGNQLLTGSDEGQVVVWDNRTRKREREYSAGSAAVRAVAFLSERLVAAGDDGVIRIWNAGALQHEWLGHTEPVLALAVSSDGRQILSGDAAGTIRVWSVPSGQTTHVLTGHDRAVQAVAFVGNGRQAVSGGADGVVRLWQLPFRD